jgi:DNA polymerase III subunit chi
MTVTTNVTEISFHFNAPDKVAYACRLLRKALNGGARVFVAGEPEALGQLDTALWTFSPLDFIPHCFGDADPSIVAASPVVLGSGTQIAASTGQWPVMVNLGEGVPDGFERFERLIEVVGTGEEDREVARDRWKHYASRGYVLIRHDLAGKPVLQ